ncbi:MAG: translation elongation factor Ts [Holosporales bacterium]|jgi:elongation factor Ts|nr:translation elongation factor Ts [Holosporales bacterium]
MAEITATLVKQLRDRTGAGMMDCKKALVETQADFEAAVDWLRTKGLAAAAKKAGRVTAEGLVAVSLSEDGHTGVVVEINSETDFVARNEAFCAYVEGVVALASQAQGDLQKLGNLPYGNGRTVQEELTQLVSLIGENLSLRRTSALSVSQGAVFAYAHAAQKPGLGRIGVLVGLSSAVTSAKLAPLGKQLAMHIAASSPQAVSVADLDPSAVAREKAVLMEQTRSSGKPEEIVAKMVEGRLQKFYQDVVLLEQPFVINPDLRVKQVLAEQEKELGGPITVSGFVRFALGEGIEKQETNFAAEVAAQLSS